MALRLFIFLIIILVLLLLVTGIVLLIRWIVRSTEKNQKNQYGQAPVVYSAQKVFCTGCGKELSRVKNFAVPVASSARCLHRVYSLHFSSQYIRRWDMCRMHPPAA